MLRVYFAFVFLLSSCLVFFTVPCLAQQNQQVHHADYALSWLQLLDKENYDEAWEELLLEVKLTTNQQEFINTVRMARGIFGVKSRELVFDQERKLVAELKNIPGKVFLVEFYVNSLDGRLIAEKIQVIEFRGKKRILSYRAIPF